MNNEYEAKFFPINKINMRRTLEELGAKLEVPERRMKRVIFQLGNGLEPKWLRIRDEGDKITCTIKEIINPHTIDGVSEIEIIVNDFVKAIELFSCIGLHLLSYQENDRETWSYNGAVLTLDTWPGIDPVLEIEGTSNNHVLTIIEKLGLNSADALFGAIDTLYTKALGVTCQQLNSIKRLSFDTCDATLTACKQ